MKISRMIEIVTILLNKKTVTASELAERFGVSVRTIYRDIDVLSSSGVPVYTLQGVNGGIAIMEDYTVERTMLSEQDKDSIMIALKSLQSTNYPQLDLILDKLGGLFQKDVYNWISVDFSPWGSNPNANQKFEDIKQAIIQGNVIEIEYINAQNKTSTRRMEPLRLAFKRQAWYLLGWCQERQAYRTFRISRIKKVRNTSEKFDYFKKRIPDQLSSQKEQKDYRNTIHCVLQFDQGVLYRLYDDYDDNVVRDNNDGTYTVELDFPEDEWVYGYILSFGPYVKVLGPNYLKEIIKEKAKRILDIYQEI